MPDPLTTDDIDAILRGGGSAEEKLQRAARIGAERAMAAPDGDLSAMLADPALERLRDWYAIGPEQRAELDTLVAWVRDLERYGRRNDGT